MKKLLQSAAVSVAMLGGGVAQAAITLDANGKVLVTPANTYEIYLSGASAVVGFIENLITNNAVIDAEQICNPAAPIYKFQDNGNGTDQNAYYCSINPTNPQLVGLAAGKTEVLLYKRSAGGSAIGVSPIVADAKAPANPAAGAVEFLNISNPALCTAPPAAGALRVSTCTYSPTVAGQFQLKKPDFGVSDVDPEQFRGSANTPAGFAAVNPADVSLMTVESAFGQAFGITATKNLRDALQEAQLGAACVGVESEACMPSLTRDQVASILVGDLDSWADLKIGASDLFAAASAPLKPGNARIHLCVRTNGSGTGATTNLNFLNYPCATSATPPKVDTGALPEALAQTQVHQMSSAGNVDVCLRELDAGNNTIGAGFNNTYTTGTLPHRWALGIQGLERNASLSSAWRFIKIDGVAPTLVNVAEGKYHHWSESTFQFANNHVFDLSENLIVNEIIKAASNPVVVATLNAGIPHPFGAGAYLSVPNNFAPDANGNYVAANPVNPYSHATTTQGVNNCRVPTVYSTTATGGIQLQ
jgi:hypothetical protein